MTTIEKLGLALLNDDRVRNGWPPVDSLAHLDEGDANAYRGSATAVLRALLEPSEAMVDEGMRRRLLSGCSVGNWTLDARDTFTAMIQTALDERQ